MADGAARIFAGRRARRVLLLNEIVRFKSFLASLSDPADGSWVDRTIRGQDVGPFIREWRSRVDKVVAGSRDVGDADVVRLADELGRWKEPFAAFLGRSDPDAPVHDLGGRRPLEILQGLAERVELLIRRSRRLEFGVAVLLLLIATIGAFALTRRGGEARTEPTSPTTSTTPSPTSPSSMPSPTSTPAPEVAREFSDQRMVKGERLGFAAYNLGLNSSDCVVHAFTFGGKTVGAYRSDCRSWETTGSGFDVVLFLVVLRNDTDRAVRFDLRNFVLVARRTEAVYGPVNVRLEADQPPAFLPETARIAPHSNLGGFLTFDGRIALVPARLSYVGAGQTLTITFEGRHTTR